MYYIYKIENEINHKIYIGLTNNIVRRRTRHFTDLRHHRHDNHFLQKEFDIYGEDNFSFSVEFQGNISQEEIGIKEREYIAFYDSYRNGYNQNEGGNFGASNGGTQFTQSDIYNILAVLDFMSKPGQVLADIYGVSRTTISRIKRGINHN
jgi:group I intron endonuclease